MSPKLATSQVHQWHLLIEVVAWHSSPALLTALFTPLLHLVSIVLARTLALAPSALPAHVAPLPCLLM